MKNTPYVWLSNMYLSDSVTGIIVIVREAFIFKSVWK